MPGGRPSEYDPDFCEEIIALGSEGASVAEMAYELGVTKQTLHNWKDAHPEFLDAFTRATLASQVWWERKGKAGVDKPATEFQGNTWSRNMAARFPADWREVKGTELTGKDGGAIETRNEANLDSTIKAIAAATGASEEAILRGLASSGK